MCVAHDQISDVSTDLSYGVKRIHDLNLFSSAFSELIAISVMQCNVISNVFNKLI